MADDHRPQSPKDFDEGVGKEIADSAECSQGKNYVLYVIGIPPDFDPDGLRNLFSECGKVKKLNLLPQKQPGWAKVGFVEYGTMPEVMKALEMYKSFQIGNYHLRASIARDRPQLRKTNTSPSDSLKDVDLGELVEKSIEQSAQRAGRRFEKMKSQKLAEKNDIEGKMKPCAVCEKLCLPTCGQCKSVYYCGSSCQREHWHEHKKVCMQRSKNDDEQPVDCKGLSTGSASEDYPLVEVDSKLVESVETQMKSIAISTKNMAIPETPKTQKEAKIYECPESVQPGAILPATLVDLQPTGIFYFQLIQDESSILGHLVQTMNEVYAQGKAATATNVEKGGIYACQFSADRQWYRGYVQSLSENGSSCNVWYVDFGNCENVPTANLVELESDFCQIPPHSVRCKLYRCGEIEPTKIPEYIAENIKSPNVEINVHHVDNSIAEVEMFGDFGKGKASLNKILIKMYGQQEKQALNEPKISPARPNLTEQNIQKQPTPEKPPPTQDASLEKKSLLKQGTSSENVSSAGKPIMSGTSGENISKMIMSPPPSGGKLKSNISSIFQKNKIKPPKPAEIHWDIPDVTRIPPGQFEAVITHVTGVEEVCCSLLGPGQEILQHLQEQLSAYCDKNYVPESFEKSKICAAKSCSAPGWYRAEMISQDSENKILVLFVDYGNKESVKIGEICKIPRDKKFWELERQAVTCKLQDCEPGGEKFNSECLGLLKQCENQMVFAEIDQNSNNRPYSVIIYIDETSTVNSYISDLKKVFEKEETPKKKEEIPVKESPLQEKKKEEVEKLENKKIPRFSLDDIKFESEGEILITHIESPGNMTFQLFGENLTRLADLSAKMSQFYEVNNTETTKDSFAIHPGNFYAIKYELDSMWYRAQVLKSASAANDTFEVLFVDYGNVEIVHKQAIKPLMDEFFSLPMQGIKGRLYGCCQNKNGKWSDESTATMQSLRNQKLAALFRAIGQEQEIGLDILVGNGQTVTEVLISAEYVEPFGESPGEIKRNESQTSTVVSNENNPQTAKVSIQKDSPTLLTPPASPPSLSTSAVKSTSSSTSKSMEKPPNSDIPSLDHGETDIRIKEEKKIPEKATIKHSIISVPKIEPVVGETHSMLVVHANSPDDFYGQIISEDLGEVSQILEELNAQCCQNSKQKTEFKTGEFCVARASDDKWYRARIVAIDESKKECSVFYIDYGNEEIVSQDRILDLSGEFAAIKSQAVPCSLSECYPVDKEWSEQSLELMKALVNQSWQVTFGKFNNELYEVELLLSESFALSDYLIQQGLATKEKKGGSPEKHIVQESKEEMKVSKMSLTKEEKIAVDVPDSTEPMLKEGDVIHLRIHKAFSPNKMIAMVVEEGKNSFSIRCRMIGIEPAEKGLSWTEESSRTLLMFATESMKAKVIQVEKDDRGQIYRLHIPTLVNALILSGLGLNCL